MTCKDCQGYFLGDGHLLTCSDCVALSRTRREVETCSTVRCPFCLHKMQVDEEMDSYFIFEEGYHTVICKNENCEKEFQVQTLVSTSFVSPPCIGFNQKELFEI